jgi:UDP-glucose 4-epimerase
MSILVTGGAGFIGSHMVDRLMQKKINVKVFDNLISGNLKNLAQWKKNPNFEFIKGDLLDKKDILTPIQESHTVFHFAANPEVQIKKARPKDHFKQNIQATYNLLEAIRKNETTEKLVFTSSSTVYGEADIFPTPENFGPMKPISMYGGSKLACEAIISAFSSMYGFTSIIYRLANIVGPRSNHGVIYDFIQKLRNNPDTLNVLGDGTQSKSYLYIDDCIEGLIKGSTEAKGIKIYNLGSEDRVSVLEIAETVKEEMNLQKTKIKLTGGVNGGRGWIGDVKKMHLEMTSIKNKGWIPRYSSKEAIRKTTQALLCESKIV